MLLKSFAHKQLWPDFFNLIIMKVTTFDLSFVLNGTKLKAKCSKFKAWKHPQFYVVVKGDKKNTLIQTFYEVNGPGKELFWFEGKDDKEPLRKAIAKALEKKSFGLKKAS